jgi:hypothetical protein
MKMALSFVVKIRKLAFKKCHLIHCKTAANKIACWKKYHDFGSAI